MKTTCNIVKCGFSPPLNSSANKSLDEFDYTLLIIIVGYSDSIVFFPEALNRKSKTNAYIEHLL